MKKLLAFKNRRGEKIEGTLKEHKKSDVLFLVCHGFKSSKDHPANVSITDKLYQLGYATFGFNFSSSADGFHLREQVTDIEDTVSFFKTYQKVYLLAGSFGALGGAIAATKTERIAGLITINGFFGSWRLGRAYFPTYVLFKILLPISPKYQAVWHFFKHSYRPEDIRCNTLVIHGRHDEGISIKQSEQFFSRISGKKTFHILETADHHLTKDSYRQEVVETIDQWLKLLQ